MDQWTFLSLCWYVTPSLYKQVIGAFLYIPCSFGNVIWINYCQCLGFAWSVYPAVLQFQRLLEGLSKTSVWEVGCVCVGAEEYKIYNWIWDKIQVVIMPKMISPWMDLWSCMPVTQKCQIPSFQGVNLYSSAISLVSWPYKCCRGTKIIHFVTSNQ